MTSIFDPRRLTIQVLVGATVLGSLLMAVSLPETGKRGLIFASTYVTIQVSRSLALMLLFRDHERRPEVVRLLRWSVISAVPWIAGALEFRVVHAVLWAVAIAVDYVYSAHSWRRLRRGRTGSTERTTLASEYLAERYQQFLIIALGESVLAIGLSFSSVGFASGRITALVVSIVTTALMWRIYLFRAGQLLAEAVEVSRQPVRLGAATTHIHLCMVAGIVTTAVGQELVIAHPLAATDPDWIGVIVGGPALFLAGRLGLEYEVFGRVSRSHLFGLLLLIVVAPVVVLVPPLAAGGAAAIVLAGVAGADAARGRAHPPMPARA